MKGPQRRVFLSLLVVMLMTFFLTGRSTVLGDEISEKVQGNIKEVTVKGLGAIISGDLASARDQAKNQALRNAVEQVMGAIVSGVTETENFMLIKDEVLTESIGYVQSYEVIDEGKEDELNYQVTLKAIVKEGDLRKAIDVLIERIKPRIMILMRERNITEETGEPVDLNISETAVFNAFKAKSRKFKFVDEATAKRALRTSEARAALSGDVKAAAALARSLSADVIIVGEAFSKVAEQASQSLGGMRSCQANVTAKVIEGDTGEIFATKSAHAAVVHIDEITGGAKAIEKASTKLVNDLMEPILEHWREKVFGSTVVQLIIKNVTFDQLPKFESTVQYAIGGFESLNRRSFDSGVALYDMRVRSDASQVAKELSSKDLGNFKVEVQSVSQNKIEIILKDRSMMK